MKSAYTGAASSLIDGKATHSIAMISIHDDKTTSAETRGKLQKTWRDVKYLITDEVPMISKTFFAKLSRNIAIGEMVEGQPPSPHLFGGISIIVCGNFFQFPPVACSLSEALYFPTTTAPRKRELSQVGRVIFEELTTVVTLSDIGWLIGVVRWLGFGSMAGEEVVLL